ncbi:MAG: hypothetical protein GX548_09030, partial [Lentisphaerae bacterium]|nr:hypothetical protein [Lentisphaerota bacterium]
FHPRLAPLSALLLLLALAPSAAAIGIERISQVVVADSEEPFSRRIYSYDIDTDSAGNLHLVYARPVSGANACDIIYATGPSPSNLVSSVLATDAKLGSISTALLVDPATDIVHVSYILHQNDPDTCLVHQSITAGVPSAPHVVAFGGWHTKMQLNADGQPLFVRENGTSLNLLWPAGDDAWTPIAFAPSGPIQYRIADFAYDPARWTYHVTYGDNAGTHNGAPLHNLHYAFSQGATHWDHEIVDDSLTLWELEFWTDLVIGGDGQPVVSMYKYAEYGGAYNTGTSLLLARRTGSAWNKQIIAGTIPGLTPPDHRAGMGGQILLDDFGILYGAWDNSPDTPIDFDGAYGNIAMNHAVSDSPWQSPFQVEPFSAEGFCRLALHGSNLYLFALAHYANAKLYLDHLHVDRSWDRTFTPIGGGWRRLSWFGDYVPMELDGWVWHAQHGFFYIPPDAMPHTTWLYSDALSWLWTARTVYPFFWSHERESWLWYNGAVNPRWFVDMQSGQWLSAP